MRVRYGVVMGLAGLLAIGAGLLAADAPFTKVAEIHVGGAGAFDYLTVDPAAKRLYLSHATEVVVIDLSNNTVIGRIADTPGVHGIAVAPLQAMMAIGALMNGGLLIPPTFIKRTEQEAAALATRVIKPETSEKMRYLMRLNVEKGTATRADVKGYYVGGKTGTSEKVVGGRYSKTKVLSAFTAVMPADQPRYLLLIMLDEPQGILETHGFATSGWNAVPVGGAVIARVAPLLGLEPRFELAPSDKLILASAKESR